MHIESSSSRVLLLALAALGLLLGVACGGAKEVTPAPVPTLTPAPRATAVPPPQPTAPAPLFSSSTLTPTVAPLPTATVRPQPTAPPARAQAGKLTLASSSFTNEEVRPSLGFFGGVLVFGAPIYDWMTWTNSDGTLAPGVLTQWEMAGDAKSWTLTVREGMKFHTGDPLTAEDIKFTFEQLFSDAANSPSPSGSARVWLANVASVEVLSPTRLQVNLKRPWPLFPFDASPRGGTEGAVIPKAYVQSVGIKGFDAKPVGTGPWKMTRHDPGARFKLEAAGIQHPYRESPKFKELEILLIPEESTRVAMLKTGATDLVELGSFDSVADLKKREGFQIFTIAALSIPALALYGADDPRIQGMPAAKREVREAMQLAINKQELVETLFGGLAPAAARYVITPGTLGYDPTWKPSEYNPNRGKELLARAGYPNGFSLKVYSYAAGGQPWLPRVAEAVVGYWGQIGITPSIIPIDNLWVSTRYRARPQAQEIIGTVATHYTIATFTNLQILRTLFHSQGNSRVVNRPEMDDLIDRASTETDQAKQIQIIREIVDLYTRENVVFPTALMPGLYGVSPRVASWKPITSTGVGTVLETVTPK